MELKKAENQTGPWTNEKHVHFLNTMEASFVRTMQETNGGYFLRLDRYLPDSSESTLDLKLRMPKNHAIPAASRRGRMQKRSSRRLLSQRLDSSQDQVVPQMGSRTGEKVERDLPSPQM